MPGALIITRLNQSYALRLSLSLMVMYSKVWVGDGMAVTPQTADSDTD